MIIIRAYCLAVSEKDSSFLEMTGQAVTKKWFVKMNLSW